MKKLLMSSVAICGLAVAATPAHAELDLDLGGYFLAYGVFADQDEEQGTEVRDFDMMRNSEVHISGETALDNGLVVGTHFELEADNNDSFEVEESYLYFSGGWGRFNVGAEDGSQFLLQVAAPSADAYVDGVRQQIDPVNYGAVPGTMGTLFDGFAALSQISNGADGANGGGDDVIAASAISTAALDLFSFDYDADISGQANKVTYLTPIFSGFQAGVSYAPENDSDDVNDFNGLNLDDEAGDYGDTYEIGIRYEGQFDSFGVIVGAGFAHAELEEGQNLLFIDADNDNAFDAGENVVSKRDDRQAWNVGIDFDIGPFGIGAAYTEDDLGIDGLDADRETIAVGVDYTTGPFKLGASYYTQDQELAGILGEGAGEIDTDRYTGGVIYTYGPGMTFRGNVSFIEHDVPNSDDVEATSVMLGTAIKF